MKLHTIIKTILEEPAYQGFDFAQKMPLKISMDMGTSFGLDAEVKNLFYMNLDEAVFGLEYRTRTEEYEEQGVGMESLQ